MARVSGSVAALVTMVAIGTFSRLGSAQESPCSGAVNRASLSRCAVEVSPLVKSVAADRQVASARLRTAAPWLPSNPVLGVSLATRRHDNDPRATNWYATVSQEFEIGGQRALRRSSAEADLASNAQRLIAARRAAAVLAWKAYFEALAARDEAIVARRLEALSTAIAEATQIMAERGVIAGLDADLADVAASRTRQARIAADGRVTSSRVTLASLLMVPVENLKVEGELEPLREVAAKARRTGDAPRPELGMMEWEARSFEARSRLWQRQRIPNLTVSAFAQNDGFNERVLGLGLAVPIALPFPIGRTYAGEIAEAQASARYTRVEASRLQLDLRRETAVALAEYESRVAERDAIAPEKFTRAEDTLTVLAAEVRAGKLAPRDAFVAQQTMIELLQGRVAARRAVCLASVELARAAGLPLEEGEP